MKLCACCGVEKPLDEFHLRKDTGRHRPQCKACWNLKSKAWVAENRGRSNEIKAEWQKRNPENLKERKARHRKLHPVDYRKWCLENPELMRAARNNWKRRNKARVQKHCVDRRANLLKATPSWADHDLMRDMYMEAEYMQMQVDHIVPLCSPLVCGLHWEGNLQLLPAIENQRKNNKHWPDMP